MKVTLHYDTIGIEILNAMVKNRNDKANEYNIKKAEKYVKYCKKAFKEHPDYLLIVKCAEDSLQRELNK